MGWWWERIWVTCWKLMVDWCFALWVFGYRMVIYWGIVDLIADNWELDNCIVVVDIFDLWGLIVQVLLWGYYWWLMFVSMDGEVVCWCSHWIVVDSDWGRHGERAVFWYLGYRDQWNYKVMEWDIMKCLCTGVWNLC